MAKSIIRRMHLHRMRKAYRQVARWARRLLRTVRRVVRKKKSRKLLAVAALVLLASFVVYKEAMPPKINPTAYTPLLTTIAKGESKGNYNAYYGNAGNTAIRFTEIPVSAVMEWQAAYVKQGSPSSAVGKYQIIRPTLAGLVAQLGIDPGTLFDESLQDRLAVALVERRGAVAFVQKELTREQFAANLAKEWAALPKATGDNPHESYYAHDGLNNSRIALDEVYAALDALEQQAL